MTDASVNRAFPGAHKHKYFVCLFYSQHSNRCKNIKKVLNKVPIFPLGIGSLFSMDFDAEHARQWDWAAIPRQSMDKSGAVSVIQTHN